MSRKKVEAGKGVRLPPFSQQCRECGTVAHITRFVRGTGGTNKPPLCKECYAKLRTHQYRPETTVKKGGDA